MMRSPRSRDRLASVLAVLAGVVLLGAVVTAYASTALFSSSHFADRATAALDDEAVRGEIATHVTDNLVINAEANLVAVRPVIESVVGGLVGAQPFQAVFRGAVADVHRAVFDRDRNTVTLTLADIGTVLRGALQAVKPEAAKQISAGADVRVEEIDPPSWLPSLLRVADKVQFLRFALLALALLALIAALRISSRPRRTTLRFGATLVLAGVTGAVVLGIAKSLLTAGIDEPQARDAARAIWDAFLGDLTGSLYLFAAAGAVIAAAASSLMQPVEVEVPLRRLGAALTKMPSSPRARVARALALILAGVAIIGFRDAVLGALVIGAGLFVAYLGVLELLRLAAPQPEAGVAIRREGKRTLLVGALTIAVIVLAAAVFTSEGGISERPAAAAAEPCNGGEDLCARPLDQVAFPATHNAMSAASNPGWLFAQQERGIADQLGDGVRGLLIDAHYGVPTKSGRVKTDLNLNDAEGKAARATLGDEATDAALRIRDRIVSSPASGPRQVYFCHGFCELGALPIDQVFGQIRDFLAANPDQVVIVVVEDYVKPSDIAEAAKRTGLLDEIYKGSLEPVPAMQEVIDSGGPAIFMAENDAGGSSIPWYHPAYEGLVQETPYSFEHPGQLTDPAKLAASCKPERGSGSAPLFLINHWIDTSPAPRPSNAKKVNADKPLLKRVHRCEKIRGLTANLVAVDFYREGDLFGAVEKLNSER